VQRVGALRDRLAAGLTAALPGAVVTASGRDRTAGICHVCVAGVESEALVYLLEKRGVFASAASSCSSGATETSHVLAAMGVPRDLAVGSLRLSLGYATADADVDLALEAVPAAVERLRMFAAPAASGS
jgi:cysteine desulfurase